MSPEQAKGLQVDGRSDQYSLAVVGYRMLTGRLPFADESVHTVIYKHIFEEPEPVETLRTETPAFLATALKRAMAKDTGDRFPTMEEFASAVWPEQRVTAASGVGSAAGVTGPSSVDAATQLTPQTPQPAASVEPTAVAEPAVVKRGGPPVVAILAAVAVVGGGGFGAWWFMGRGEPVQTPQAETAGPTAEVTPPTENTVVDTPDPEPPAAETSPPVQTDPPVQTETPVQQPAPRPDPVRQPQREVTPPPASRGSVTINATPFGTVFVDNALVGDTPVFAHELPVGQHVIEVRKEGYVTAVDTVTITAGQNLRRNYRLEIGGGL
jgi:serine/threonine-protein kinase